MKKFLVIFSAIILNFLNLQSSNWRYIEFPTRISSNLAVCGSKIFVGSLDTTVIGFWLEKNADTFNIVQLTKKLFLDNLLNYDTVYDSRFRLFQGNFGGTLDATIDGSLWLVGICAFKNYLGLDSFLFKIYVYKNGKFLGVSPMIFTQELDTIKPLRTARLLGSGGNSMPWLFESRIVGDTTLIFLSYSQETAEGFSFFVKDTISFMSSLRIYFNGFDVDGYGNLSLITNDLLKTISPTKTIRELRLDHMFPQIGMLSGLKIDKKNGYIYLFDRGFNLVKFDGNSWTFKRLPILDTFPIDARKTALIAIDSAGSIWATMNSYFKHIYRVTPDEFLHPIPLPADLTGNLSTTLQIDGDGVLYFVGNKLYPDSSIKSVLYFLDTRKILGNNYETPSRSDENTISIFSDIANERLIINIIVRDGNEKFSSPNVHILNFFGEILVDTKTNWVAKEKYGNFILLENHIDISNLPSGYYLIRTFNHNNCYQGKFLLIK